MRVAGVEEALGEAKSQASVIKEARATKARASKTIVKAVDGFKIGGEYCQMVLDSYKKTFQQCFKLCKKRVTERFPGVDIGKLMVESHSSSSKDSLGSSEDSKEGEDPTSLP